MSFGFLPAPIYIILFVALSIAMFNYGIKVRHGSPRYFSIGAYLLAISGFLEAVIKFIEEYWLAAIGFSGTLKVMVGICIVGGFILIAVNI